MFELNFGEFRTDVTTTDDVLRVEAILERKWGSARRAAPVVLKPSAEESAVHELISLSTASLTKSGDASDLLGRLGLSPESVEALERLEKSLTQHGEHERDGGEGGAAETPPETAGDEDGSHESGSGRRSTRTGLTRQVTPGRPRLPQATQGGCWRCLGGPSGCWRKPATGLTLRCWAVRSWLAHPREHCSTSIVAIRASGSHHRRSHHCPLRRFLVAFAVAAGAGVLGLWVIEILARRLPP